MPVCCFLCGCLALQVALLLLLFFAIVMIMTFSGAFSYIFLLVVVWFLIFSICNDNSVKRYDHRNKLWER